MLFLHILSRLPQPEMAWQAWVPPWKVLLTDGAQENQLRIWRVAVAEHIFWLSPFVSVWASAQTHDCLSRSHFVWLQSLCKQHQTCAARGAAHVVLTATSKSKWNIRSLFISVSVETLRVWLSEHSSDNTGNIAETREYIIGWPFQIP